METAAERQHNTHHRLQGASRAFQVQKWVLCDEKVSIADSSTFTVYSFSIQKLLQRSALLLVVARTTYGWASAKCQWEYAVALNFAHIWHSLIDRHLECDGFKSWPTTYSAKLRLQNYVALLSERSWIKHVHEPKVQKCCKTLATSNHCPNRLVQSQVLVDDV